MIHELCYSNTNTYLPTFCRLPEELRKPVRDSQICRYGKTAFLFCLALIFSLLLCGCGKGNVTQTHITADHIMEQGDLSGSSDQAAHPDAPDGSADDQSLSAADQDAVPVGNMSTALSVPTQITKIGDYYFIVDCYNDQVIYSESLDLPLNEWYVMTSDISKGHTVASDGEIYLVDDTENHRVLVFEYRNGVFVNTSVFENIGVRPHFIVYNEEDGCFYVWSSMTGEMYVFEHDSSTGEVFISRIMKIDELDGVYVRSFTIEGDRVYLVSGNSEIIEARLSDFKVIKKYPVPPELAGMIQIMPVEGGYYITISTDVHGNQDFATIIFTEKLSDLEQGSYTDIYSYFVGGGTPYYLGCIDGTYYLTEHRLPGHSIWAFDIGEDHMPANVRLIY